MVLVEDGKIILSGAQIVNEQKTGHLVEEDQVKLDGNTITIVLRKADRDAAAIKAAKAKLADAIKAATALKGTEGAPAEAVTALDTAIGTAQTAHDNKEATVESLEEALKDLNTAVETFNKAVEEAPLNEALAAVNAITGTDADIKTIKDNAEVLGLDLTAFNALDAITGQTGGRQKAVMGDLKANMPTAGYKVEDLQKIFNSIVAVRTATQTSMNMVNDAETLEDIEYVEILLNAFKNAEHGTHSGISMTKKIKDMQELVDDFNALGKADQATVLETVINARPEGGFLSSSLTTKELRTAIDALNTQP